MPAGACPEQGHLAEDADGSSLLLLHCKAAARVTVLRITSDDAFQHAPKRVEVGASSIQYPFPIYVSP